MSSCPGPGGGPFFPGRALLLGRALLRGACRTGGLGPFNETVLSSRLFLRLMNYRPFLGLTALSPSAAVPRIVISLWPLHKGPFAGLHAGAGGRGKLIWQPEPGAVWEPF